MPLAIGATGVVGVAFESVVGTYVPPTKFMFLESESITWNEDKQYLAPIRGIPGPSALKPGYNQIEGDVTFEVTAEHLLYWLYASRHGITKSGTTPFTYTFVPANVVSPTTAATGTTTRRTLSVYVERGGQPFGFAGCTVGNISFSIGDNGNLMATMAVLGRSVDTTVAVATPTYSSTWLPYGPGKIGLEIPSGTARSDIDTWSLDISHNAESLNRIKVGTRSPQAIRWGAMETTGSFDQDFNDMVEWNAFINSTVRTMKMIAENNSTNDHVSVDVAGMISNSYPISLGSVGDLVRASVDYTAIHNAGNPPYTITVKSAESIL